MKFKSVKQLKSGSVGRIFNDFGATLHLLQTEQDLLDTEEPKRELNCRVILFNHEEKRIVLGNTENIMDPLSIKPTKDRDGEKISGTIEISDGFGLIIANDDSNQRSFCPFYNITEHRDNPDILSQYPVGKKVRGRIISYCYMEGMPLMTMRESVVEAKFFRYDEFTAGQIVDVKVTEIEEKSGWLQASLAPHLHAVITKQHHSNVILSDEAIKQKFKPGMDLKQSS